MYLKTFILFLSAALLSCGDSSSEKEPEEIPQVITEEATTFNAFFTRYGNGWTGGDVAYSIRLPDNRDLWLFGDTFLGEVNPDRSRAPQGFVNNSFVIMDGQEATTLVGSGPSAFVKPENADEKYWPQHGFVKNNKLYVLMYTWKNTGTGGAFGFKYIRTDLAIFDLPSITLTEIKPIPGSSKVIWGAGIMEHGDHIYIYGSEDTPEENYMHLARIRSDDVEGTWEYFTAFGWAQDAAASKRIIEGVSNHFSVFQYNDAYYLINHEDGFSHKINRYKATKPEGPFTDKLLIYTTPSLGASTWTYNAKAHIQYLQDGKLLISHDANTLEFNDLFKNADFYRPYFVWVKNWE
jgi:hypothetical protein